MGWSRTYDCHLQKGFRLHLPNKAVEDKMTRVTRKQVFVVVIPRPSFFWYDTDFSEFDPEIIDYILEKSVSYQKKDEHGHVHPSFFWMTTTKTLRSVFSWCVSIVIQSVKAINLRLYWHWDQMDLNHISAGPDQTCLRFEKALIWSSSSLVSTQKEKGSF